MKGTREGNGGEDAPGKSAVAAENALRESQERQKFLLKLSDGIRPLTDPVEIMATVSEEVGRHFGVGRCGYAEVPPPYTHLVVARDWTNGAMQSLQGSWPLESFGEEVIAEYRTGKTMVFSDTFEDPRTRDYRDGMEAVGGVRSSISAQLLKEGRWVACFYVQDTAPRQWTPNEIKLIEDVAERTWAAAERARAEEALRASEAKYRTLFDSIDEGLAIVEMIYDDQGEIVDMIFRQVNSAYERQGGIYNVIGRSVVEMLPGVEKIWLDRYKQVARSGEPLRVVDYQRDVDRWFEVYFSRVDEDGRFVAIVFNDISERKRAEAALRDSEERQVFLLALGDAMRAQSSANAMIEVAARMLGERLNASRVLFAEFDEARGIVDVFHGWFADGAKPFPAVMRLEDYEGPIVNDLRAGRTVRIEDAGPPFERPDLAAIAELGVKALLSVPLIIGGRLKVNLSVHQDAVRRWTDEEVSLVQEVAERLWADLVWARTEEALRASEEKYRHLFEAMGQGYAEIELLRDEQGRAVDQRYIEFNPAFERLIGIPVSQAKGRNASEVLPELEPWWHETFAGIAQRGEPERVEYQVASLGRWYEVYAYPRGGDRLTVLYQDITERARNQAALHESEQRFRQFGEASSDVL